MFRPRMGRRRVLADVAGLMVPGGRHLGPRARLSQRAGTCVRGSDSQRSLRAATAAAAAAAAATTTTRNMATTATADSRGPPQPSAGGLPDLDRVVALVSGARARLLGHPGVPSEEETAATLQICGAAADLIMDASVQPQLSSIDHQADTAASTLLSLDGRVGGGGAADATAATGSAGPAGSTGSTGSGPPTASPRFRDVVGQISDAAYAVIEDRRVRITPRLLAQYVGIQARLGRPASLPHVLELYASKPVPRSSNTNSNTNSNSNIRYVAQSPGRPARAVQVDVAEAALDAALAARDLDAAVGVVEHTYAAAAFVRAKVLRKGFLPGFAVVGVPLATYSLASQLAAVQTTLDDGAATVMAFAAIMAYIGFTGAIGAVANATANDQMRRVTWAPGTPLRERWVREDERAALDKVTCAFGFSDAYRYGEEEGAEFQALREYVMRKGMLIDQNEMLEGMSS